MANVATALRPAAATGCAPEEGEGKAGTFKKHRVSPFYLLALTIVALVMIALPATYLAMIGGVGTGIAYHAVENVDLLRGGAGMKARLFAYLAPIAAGGVLILFMVKPLFAPRSSGPRGHILTRSQEPALHAFVERLSTLVGAPAPRSIEVNCQVNAWAGFRRGWRSVLGGNDLVLTIGLPLATRLTSRQLAGVLAHELGHFSQGFGMRLSHTIRTINAWFARVVHERDAWDEGIERACRGLGSGGGGAAWIGLTAHLARAVVWTTRQVLGLLMRLGRVVSCNLLRRMEFDADRYEAFVAGSDEFEVTSLGLRLLARGSATAFDILNGTWMDGRLADNLPRLVAQCADTIPRPQVAAVRKGMLQEKTRLFDTHPSSRERIRAAKEAKEPGIFLSDAPAATLFRDLEALSKTVSFGYYRAVLGSEVSPSNLVSPGRVLGDLVTVADRTEKVARASAPAPVCGETRSP